jgi:hypothetical protein
MVRLGLTARVRDVDPLGRIALVSHWRRPLRLFDLRRLAWIDLELPRRLWLFARRYPPRLSGDGRLFYAEIDVAGGDTLFSAVRARELRTGQIQLIAHHTPFGSTGVSATNDRYWYATETQHVAITNNGQRSAVTLDHVWLVEPLPRKVIHAVHVDGERDLIAAGSWSEVVLHRIVDGKLERVGYTKTEAQGEVRWLAVAGRWLVAAIREITTPEAMGIARGDVIEVRRIGDDLSIGPVEERYVAAAGLSAAALSRDGRHLALALGRGLTVYELGTAYNTLFDEHTDQINYLRFAAEDHVLISADTDNRIVMRPRTPSGYARPLISINIPDQAIALPS